MTTTAVPMTTFSMRMSADLKRNLEDVCRQMGLSVSAAITMFATQVVRERRIPFIVSADSFWNEATQRRLEHSYAQLKAGKVQESDPISETPGSSKKGTHAGCPSSLASFVKPSASR
mgnify:CR=1 FL=1